MFERTLTTALQFGLHALLVVAAAWLGVHTRRASAWTGVGAGLALVVTLVYAVIQHIGGLGPRPLLGGELAAQFVATCVSLIGSVVAGHFARRMGARALVAIMIGVVTGLLLLGLIPALRLRLGCGFTGICP
jgi:hypothetical protein